MSDSFKHLSIDFGNGKIAKYCTVNQENPSEKIDFLKIIHDHWGLKMPKYLISVIGGARFLKGNEEAIRCLCDRIVQFAVKNNAWIITAGTNCGVMSAVGQRVAGTKVVTIGVTETGVVKGSDIFNVFDTHTKEVIVDYQSIPDPEPNGMITTLEPNHTHYILVRGKEYGDGILSKSAVELAIAENITQLQRGERKQKCITILIDGGGLTVADAEISVKNKWPLLVISDTGRAADDITLLYQQFASIEQVEKRDAAITEFLKTTTLKVDGKRKAIGELVKKSLILSIIICVPLIDALNESFDNCMLKYLNSPIPR